MSFRREVRAGAINNEPEIAFEVCKFSMHRLYKMGAEEAAKRELWDMMVIANGGDSYRRFGGAETRLTDDGDLEVVRELSEPLKYIDAEMTVGDLGNQ